MADTTITGLPNASALTGTERVPMDQAGTTVDAAVSAIAALATAATVGLGSCNNTADLAKPISTATQTALDLKANASGTLAQFGSTTSAQLLGVISDETGTGSLVFATSPTLVTPALGTPSSGTLTNCTGLPFDAGVSSKPTTLSGYGITDAVGTSDARLSDARTPTAHNQAFSTITGTPTTLGGYGITDGFTEANVRATPITGFTSGAGTVAATDTILQALQKLNGNIAASSGLPASLTADGSNNLTLTARWIQSTNGAASAPPHSLTGTWFTGGQASTTKPQFLIEPAGTTSNNWSISGTGFGVNAPTGFAGDLAWLGVNGAPQIRISSAGAISFQPASSNTLISPTAYSTALLLQTDVEPLYILPCRSGTSFPKFSFVHISNAGRTPGFNISSDHSLNWSDGTNVATANADLRLFRDAANTLAQRNGTAAQASRIYNTYTSDTNFERAKIEWASNILRIGTEKGSAGGTARDMELQTDGTTRITVKASGAIIFSGLPTSDPNVAGQLWNHNGTLKISA
jgi:hypothetical protein